jgi:transcription-repair coupling factor (superfamily II helicase)
MTAASESSAFAQLGDRLRLSLEHPSQDPESLLDPLPDYDPPPDPILIDTATIARHLHQTSRLHVTGCHGSATAWAACAIARTRNHPVLCITATPEQAQQLVLDLQFLWGQDQRESDDAVPGQVLSLTATEASPYAEVNPDRRGAHHRLATLSHLASDLPFRFLVTHGTALLRKIVPRSVVEKYTHLIEIEQEIDRAALIDKLSESGYLRSPLVEDPGTFAIRGSLVDVWAAGSKTPIRIEFVGDVVVSLKAFDPDTQRTLGPVVKCWLPPAREAIRTADSMDRARRVVRELCDTVDLPSSRTHALVEDIVSGRLFLGLEGMLPAYFELTSIGEYLTRDYTVVMQDPDAIARAVHDEYEQAQRDEMVQAMLRKQASGPPSMSLPRFAMQDYFTSEKEVSELISRWPMLVVHPTATVGQEQEPTALAEYSTTPPDTPTLGTQDLSELGRAIQSARMRGGKASALTPLIRRIQRWRELGLRVLLTARADSQAERLAALLRCRGIDCRAKLGPFDPTILQTPGEPVLVVRGALSQGVVAPTEGWVLVTEEEVFGRRAKRRAQRARSSSLRQPFIQDLRALSPGDLVIHVEHGVGKYLGLLHKKIDATTVDLIAIEYAGGDKLYLPVYRLNQIQKHTAADAKQKLDRLGGLTFARTKSRVRANVRKMADELLQLYAQRQALAVLPLSDVDDEYRAFEATFPFEETRDQAIAIDDVMRDLTSDRPMDRLVCGDVGFGKTEVAIRAAFRAASQSRQVAVLCPTTVLAQQHLMSFRSRLESYGIDVRGLSRFQSKKEQTEVLRGLRAGFVDVVIGTHRLLSKDVHFKSLGLLVVDEEQRFGVAHKERIKQLKQSVDVLSLSATPIPRTLQMAVSGLRDISLIGTPPVDRRAIRTIVTRQDDRVLREAIERELSRNGQVFFVYNRVEGLYERAAKLQELLPEARIAVAHGQMPEATLERTMLDFVEGRYDVLASTSIIESGIDIPRANTIIIDRADMFGLAQLYQLRGRVGRSKERAYCYLVVPPVDAMTDEARARVEAIEQHSELGSGFHIASLDLELRGSGDLLGAEQSGNVASVGFDLFRQMLEDAVHELRGEPVIHDIEPELSFDVEALLPEDYIADIGVRLSFYQRLASASDEQDVEELSIEMQDRFGAPPEAALHLVQLMRQKTELRRIRVLACEANARSVVLHLADDHLLDSEKLIRLVQQRPRAFQVSPDMRLFRKATEKDAWKNGIEALETMLQEIGAVREAR